MSTITPEKRVEDALLSYLTEINAYAIKNQASATTGKGRPDISACVNGRYMAIEVKHGKGTSKTTLMQYNHLIRIAKAKGLSYYVNNVEDFQYNIQTLLKTSTSNWKKVTPKRFTPKEFLSSLNSLLHKYTILRITKTGEILVLKDIKASSKR